MSSSLWSITAALGGIVFFLIYKFFTRNFNYWKDKNVYFVKPVPFFGNMFSVFTMKESLGEFFKGLYDNTPADYFGIFVMDRPVLVLKNPQMIKCVLQKEFSSFEDRTSSTSESDPVMSNLMFFKKQPGWKPIRSKMSPVFTSGKLKLMFPLIENEARNMTDYISTMANVPNVETKELCAKFSTNVIAKVAFGVDAQSFKYEDALFRQIGRKIFDFRLTTALRQFSAFFLPPAIIQTFNVQFFDSFTRKTLKTIFTDVLRSRKESKQLKGNDLVDILLETEKNNKEKFTEHELLAQALQFFIAGFETVSSTISFLLYELAMAPEIQEKLRNEIEENFKNTNGLIYDILHDMKYLDMCVSETLRKYPVLPFLDRTCNETFKFPDTDLVINKGGLVYIPLFGLHYDTKFFPDPYKFDPERFANKHEINRDGLYYIPFGEGPRICIGNRFGLMTVKICVSHILQKFKLEKSSKTPVPIKFEPRSIVIQSTVGVPLKFVPI